MRVVVEAIRQDCVNSNVFRTEEVFEHVPVEIDRTATGWTGCGAGLSDADLKEAFDRLRDSAANIIDIRISLRD